MAIEQVFYVRCETCDRATPPNATTRKTAGDVAVRLGFRSLRQGKCEAWLCGACWPKLLAACGRAAG